MQQPMAALYNKLLPQLRLEPVDVMSGLSACAASLLTVLSFALQGFRILLVESSVQGALHVP
jgi:hypothetical protein